MRRAGGLSRRKLSTTYWAYSKVQAIVSVSSSHEKSLNCSKLRWLFKKLLLPHWVGKFSNLPVLDILIFHFSIVFKHEKRHELTFFQNKPAGMVEEEVSEVIAVGVDAGLLAKTRWPEERKCLKGPKRCLTFCYCHCAAGDWKSTNVI